MGESEHAGVGVASEGAAKSPYPDSPGRNVPRRRSRRRSPASARSGTRGKLRAGYFTLAAIWGCLAGTGVLVVGLSSLEQPVRLDPTVAGLLGLAVILAVVGGLVAAAAYRAASRRLG